MPELKYEVAQPKPVPQIVTKKIDVDLDRMKKTECKRFLRLYPKVSYTSNGYQMKDSYFDCPPESHNVGHFHSCVNHDEYPPHVHMDVKIRNNTCKHKYTQTSTGTSEVRLQLQPHLLSATWTLQLHFPLLSDPHFEAESHCGST